MEQILYDSLSIPTLRSALRQEIYSSGNISSSVNLLVLEVLELSSLEKHLCKIRELSFDRFFKFIFRLWFHDKGEYNVYK